jgi:hypothetical protein
MQNSTLKLLFPLFLAALLSVACTSPAEETESEGNNSETEENNLPTNNAQSEASTLDLVFIAGHLGSYWDCPNEAYTEGEGDAPPAAEAGDCAPDAEDCGGILNCEGAQLSVQITNVGEDPVSGVEVIDIAILDGSGTPHVSLPILGAYQSDGSAFDGTLDAGEAVSLRVDFRGPLEPSDYADDTSDARSRGGLPLRVKSKAEGQGPAALDTPEIEPIPAIAT